MTSATRLRSTAILSASSRVKTTCGHPVALMTMSARNMHFQRSARVAAVPSNICANSRARVGDWSITTTDCAPFSTIWRAESSLILPVPNSSILRPSSDPKICRAKSNAAVGIETATSPIGVSWRI